MPTLEADEIDDLRRYNGGCSSGRALLVFAFPPTEHGSFAGFRARLSLHVDKCV